LAGVLAIILFLVEKTPSVIVAMLVFMFLLCVYPVLHFVRSLNWRGLSLALVLVAILIFGWRVWPERPTANVAAKTNDDHAIAPRNTLATDNVAARPDNAQTPQSPSHAVRQDRGRTDSVTMPKRHGTTNSESSGKDSQPPQDNSVHLEKGAQVEQHSSGDCSPNIIGGSSTVNCAPPPPPAPNVEACVTYSSPAESDVENHYATQVVLSTDRAIPSPFFALIFDGPVSKARMINSGGSSFIRADKLPNPERTFIFKFLGFTLGGAGTWYPGQGKLSVAVESKDKVTLVQMLSGGGDDPDGKFSVNISFACD
jgi:hypothetical protein